MLKLKSTGQVVYPMPEARASKPPRGYVDILVPLPPRPGRSHRKPLKQGSIMRVQASKLEEIRRTANAPGSAGTANAKS